MKRIFAVTLLITAGCITTTNYDYSKTPDLSNNKDLEAKRVVFKFTRNTLTSGTGKFDKEDADKTLKGSWAAPLAEGVAQYQFSNTFKELTRSCTRTPSFTESGNDHDIMMDVIVQNGWNAWTLPFAAISGFT